MANSPAPFLWLCGPPAVGKSTVGYEVFTQVNRSGVKAAYVDLSQIGFCRPARDGDPTADRDPAADGDPDTHGDGDTHGGGPDAHRLRALNLGAMWPVFRAAGARCLVVTGRVADHDTVARYAEAVPGTVLTLCRLRAGRDRLTQRILARGRGGGPPIMGDELRGLPADELHRIAERAVRCSGALDRTGLGDVCVDTDRGSVEELARLVRERTGWPRF
ncbi:MAG TPA: hypothetical protein VGJ07_33070 [Rugosimonospora sp.]|jgi:hypothetical protein